MNDQYLWDKSGEVDEEIAQLETLLSPYRFHDRPLTLPVRRTRWFWWPKLAFAATAAVCVLVALWFVPRPELRLLQTQGSLQSNRSFLGLRGLAVGDWIRTELGGQAELRIANIGRVTLHGDSELQVLESRESRRRFELRYGSMHASILAPPAVFIVDTPAARAVDLGCEYDLNVDREGNGTLVVTAGWVMLNYNYDKVLVPKGAEAMIRKGGLLSPPFFAEASPNFRAALQQWSFERPTDARQKTTLLSALLSSANKRDAYTLITMLNAALPDERLMIFDRLNELVPAPEGIARNEIAYAGPEYWEHWWTKVRDELGLTVIKKKGWVPIGTYPAR